MVRLEVLMRTSAVCQFDVVEKRERVVDEIVVVEIVRELMSERGGRGGGGGRRRGRGARLGKLGDHFILRSRSLM